MIRSAIQHFVIKNNNVSAPDNNFHAIRYLLALMVLYSHSFGLLALKEPIAFSLTFGSLAVKCFFALSGYFIALSCLRTGSLLNYSWNRFLRIVPALVVALFVSYQLGDYFDYFISNPVPYIVNGPVWTLSWEVLCYVLLGFLWWLGLLSISSLGAIVISSWVMFVSFQSISETATVISPLLLLFFSGAYLGLAINEKKVNLKYIGPFSFFVLVICFFDLGLDLISLFFEQVPFLYGPNISVANYQFIVVLMFLPFALLWVGYFKRVLPVSNDYSYGMYIFAWPVQQVLISTLDLTSPSFCFSMGCHSLFSNAVLAYS